MGRKKKQPDDKVTPSEPGRKVVYERGNWTVGKRNVGFTKVTVRATFADDPEGCRGYGNTEREALDELNYYANL